MSERMTREELDVRAEWLRLDGILARALGRCDDAELKDDDTSDEAWGDVQRGIIDARRELWAFCKTLLAERSEATPTPSVDSQEDTER